MVRHIRLDRYEVTAHYSDVMVINSKHERRVDRCVDQAQEVFFALVLCLANMSNHRQEFLLVQKSRCI